MAHPLLQPLLQPLLHPMVRLTMARPGLLADHVQAYTELAASELQCALARWTRLGLLRLGVLCGGVVGCLLAGVALMLWAMLPAALGQNPWVLLAVPLPPFLLAWCCWRIASRPNPVGAFDNLRGQLVADLDLLRHAGAA
jgi:hypothetical protein